MRNLSTVKRIFQSFPPGHRFFPDCQRENYARFIEWAIKKEKPIDAWFATLTFKTYISEIRADILLRKWLGKMNAALSETGNGRLRWILATEWQKRNVIHFHLIILGDGLGTMSRKRWECRWQTQGRSSGFARIYDVRKKAAPYLSKYMKKEYRAEVQLGGFWRGYDVPSSVKCDHTMSGIMLNKCTEVTALCS
jgi:hypothetical protein